jgi:filamentous hemagglutinin family protein
MNHIYRTIWNEALGVWMAVSELAKGRGKQASKRQKLFIAGLLLCSSSVWALPTGNELVAGQATVATPNAGQLQINQASQKAVINWQGFSINPNEAVNIQQPNAQAALLNRVVGQDASQIQGQLNANGQVYLVNPNGVVFGKTAQVDVGGLVASTHDISTADFMNGKNHFTQNGATGKVENHGTINAKDGGVVALIGEQVSNTGTINTPKGTTALAAGKTVDLDFQGDGLVEVKVTESALNAQITNRGAIQADGGRVVMTAKAANSLIDTVINQEGVVRAQGLVERNGEIILDGGYVAQTGTLDVSGKTGGKVDIQARAILDAGKTNADGAAGNGGNINMKASDAIIQTAAADTHANGTTTGGTIHLKGANSVYSSGKLSVTGDKGGTIDVVSNDRVVLAAADVNASGKSQGGLVRVGGDFHGANAKLPNAKTTLINGATKIKADGGKGKVVVWSNDTTDYYGSISANKAGEIEVSSKGTLTYSGSANAGMGGSLLLDPKNIVISSTGNAASYALIDPHAAAGNNFGAITTLLGTTVGKVFTENGNIAVSSPYDDFAARDAGAVYLFNTTTGALLATLTGSSANDNVSGYLYFNGGITALTNGNYVVASPNWNNGMGAATWGNGTTGISGTISSTNSLVGSTAGDYVGWYGVTALTNGNYVVGSSDWNNYRGAATWGNGTTGISGTVNSTNSLVDSTTYDMVGSITALTNGNYVVGSYSWNNYRGAATWGNGTTGMSGTVSSTNSLVGSIAGDAVGGSITALTNGNYVVGSYSWNNYRGAATWGNGTTGISGMISSINSLVGSTATASDWTGTIWTYGDGVGNGITALSNGNYVVGSSGWNNGMGAATWGNGTRGISGTISSANSLVGSIAGDAVGGFFSNITALTNGNYVVGSPNWNNRMGAATWGNGTTGMSGTVSSTNSLVGSMAGAGDWTNGVGSRIIALTNGNYVVGSSGWNNGMGAATWGNGTRGISGTISSANSLVGSTAGDYVGGYGRITALTNGNYVVAGYIWDNGSLVDAGQVRIGTPSDILFNYGVGQTMTFNPSNLADTLASGTNVTLQANNDITLNAGADIIVSGNNGGALTLQAGRNINLNSIIRTANGDFTAIAGDPNALAADREAGTPTITLGSGATINAGTGKVILAAIGGNFVNNSGSTRPITAIQWLIYTTDPRLDILNGMTADYDAYGQPYTGMTPSYASRGNWFLYSNPYRATINPTITRINRTIAVNLLDINFWLSQLTPLQISTTFLYNYQEKLHDNEEVDVDFGQYKRDANLLKTFGYEQRRAHGGIKLP